MKDEKAQISERSVKLAIIIIAIAVIASTAFLALAPAAHRRQNGTNTTATNLSARTGSSGTMANHTGSTVLMTSISPNATKASNDTTTASTTTVGQGTPVTTASGSGATSAQTTASSSYPTTAYTSTLATTTATPSTTVAAQNSVSTASTTTVLSSTTGSTTSASTTTTQSTTAGSTASTTQPSTSISSTTTLSTSTTIQSTTTIAPTTSVSTSTTTTQPSTAYVPITVQNSQSSATADPFQLRLDVPSSTYSSYINSVWSNVEFTSGTPASSGGTPLHAWVESNATNTASKTIVWISVPGGLPQGSTTIYMNFMPSAVMSSSGPTGEAPELSQTYGGYDNGAQVFTYYWNFAGTSLPSGWYSSGSFSVNNKLIIGAGPASGFIDIALSLTEPLVLESYTDTTLTSSTSVYNGYNLFLLDSSYNQLGTSIRGDGQPDEYFSFYYDGSASIGTPVPFYGYGTYQIVRALYAGAGSSQLYSSVGNLTASAGPSGNTLAPTGIEVYTDGGPQQTYWIRVRAYPPDGVMPTATFGSPSTFTTASTTSTSTSTSVSTSTSTSTSTTTISTTTSTVFTTTNPTTTVSAPSGMAVPQGYTASDLQINDNFENLSLWNEWIGNTFPWEDCNQVVCRLAPPYSGNNDPDVTAQEGYTGFDAEYMSPYQISTGSSGLSITAGPKPSNAPSGTQNYSAVSGSISGYSKLNVAYGPTGCAYVQALIKFPSFPGAWGGFWALGSNTSDEVDVIESGYTGHGPADYVMASNWHSGGSQAYYDTGINLTTSFNTYGVEICNGKNISIYFTPGTSGTRMEVAHYTQNIPTNEKWNFMINLQVANSNAAAWHTVWDGSSGGTLYAKQLQVYSR